MLATWSPVPGGRPGAPPAPGAPTPQTATTTLYLVDPSGGRYAVTTFGPTSNGAPKVIDWSGDRSHALLEATLPGPQTTITEVDLHSGTQTTFTVEGFVSPRYTRPEGKAVLLATWPGSRPGSLKRVDLAGKPELTYPVGPGFGGGYLSTPDGKRLVLGTSSGLALMGNDGAAGAALPIAAEKDCAPMRWWDAGSTIAVTRCSDHGLSRLWLVPIGGGTPTALTAPLNGQGPDYGDGNAWQLPAGTFVQEAGACGSQYLGKLNAVGGTTTPVSVPGVDNAHSVVVVGVNRGNLDLHATASCGGGQSLFDYNPAAGTSTVLLGPPVNGGGVIAAVPYPGQG
jgi:TolB protein